MRCENGPGRPGPIVTNRLPVGALKNAKLGPPVPGFAHILQSSHDAREKTSARAVAPSSWAVRTPRKSSSATTQSLTETSSSPSRTVPHRADVAFTRTTTRVASLNARPSRPGGARQWKW